MAVRPGGTPPRNRGGRLTGSDLKVILCTVVFLLSVLIKYTDFGPAQSLRTQAASLIRGGMDAQQTMQVLGHLTQDGGLRAVFAKNERLQQVFGAVRGLQPAAKTQTGTSGTTAAEPQADSGYEEDLIDRAESNFPKQTDDVVYAMKFTHVNPVKGLLSSPFGMRTHPVTGKKTFHYGLDIAADKGTPIGSLAAGTVRAVGERSYGNYVIVDHADGFSTLYAHCSVILAKKEEKVKAGQEIAQVGATGLATGNHLHLEVWHNGKALNPANYVSYPASS